MRTRCLPVITICLFLFVQPLLVAQQQHPSLLLETGWFADHDFPLPDVATAERLTGTSYHQHYSDLLNPRGRTTTVRIPLVTLGWRQPAGKSRTLGLYAGISYLVPELVTAHFVDTNLTTVVTAPGNRNLLVDSSHVFLQLRAKQLNIPLGIRWQPTDPRWQWLSVGLQAAPGWIFDQKLATTTIVASHVIMKDSNGDTLEIRRSPGYTWNRVTEKRPGGFFTGTVSVPLHARFRILPSWLFTLGVETGYAVTFYRQKETRGNLASRVTAGLQYQFSRFNDPSR